MSDRAMILDPEMGFRGLTRGEYDALVATGALDDERVELLDGGLYGMTPQRWHHVSVVSRLRRHLERAWFRADDARFLVHTPRIYARAGFPEYWVVDLSQSEVVVHRDPRPDLGQYAWITRQPFADPVTACGVTVRFDDLVT